MKMQCRSDGDDGMEVEGASVAVLIGFYQKYYQKD